MMKNNNLTLHNGPYLTDGGLETTLIFHEGIALNHFAAFELISSKDGRETLKEYYKKYLAIASRYNLNYMLETPTWRANPDWGRKLGYNTQQLSDVNRKSVRFMREIVAGPGTDLNNILISGCVGPRGDGYEPRNKMTAYEAMNYHKPQVSDFALEDADMVSALTMNYIEEAVGITLASKMAQIPVVISFTLETDGKLPAGDSLKEAIEKVDSETGCYPLHYMINCAHPEHFADALEEIGDWRARIRGIRANASTKSHAELDESTTLDIGNMEDLAIRYKNLHRQLPNLAVYGGCCGTDHRHIDKVCEAMFTTK